MGIHREGTPTLLIVLAILCFGTFAAWTWAPLWLAYPVVILLVAVFAIVLWFFRVPKRTVKPDDQAVFSPCDGKVVVIEEVHEPEYFNDKRIQVSIFMSPINVHINFNPISGTVRYYKYHPGKYLVAWHPKSSTENERSTVVIEHPRHGSLLFRQIAGALARRIVTYSQVNDPAQQGAEFGFIKFGSRVDVYLPLNATVTAKIGDVVQGSLSTIARFNS